MCSIPLRIIFQTKRMRNSDFLIYFIFSEDEYTNTLYGLTMQLMNTLISHLKKLMASNLVDVLIPLISFIRNANWLSYSRV